MFQNMNNYIFNISQYKPVILGTGLVALDVVLTSETHFPPRLWAGGTCGNILIILSYLGWDAYPIARCSNDIAANHVLRDFKQWDVQLDFATSLPSANTPTIIQRIKHAADGKVIHKFSWRCPYCDAPLPGYKAILATTAQEIIPRIKEPKVFFLDRVSRGALMLAKASADKGAIIVFEPSGIGNEKLFQEAVSIANIIKYSEERISAINFKSAANPFIEIKTLGQKGLAYRAKLSTKRVSAWQQLDAYKIDQVRDTSGSGDWCTAGIIHCIGQQGVNGLNSITDSNLYEAIRFGQALAAWNCSFEGARGGMYSVNKAEFQSQVLKILSEKDSKIPISYHPVLKTKNIFGTICQVCEKKERMVFNSA